MHNISHVVPIQDLNDFPHLDSIHTDLISINFSY